MRRLSFTPEESMNLFESVKDAVSTRAAAEMYGLQVDRKGFCKCTFHADKKGKK